MKANTVFNASLFRRPGGHTGSISSAVMIGHPLEAGMYEGQVYQHGQAKGSFTLACREDDPQTQADIDLSHFGGLVKDDCGCDKAKTSYTVKEGGYGFFFTSKGDDGYEVTLTPVTDKRDAKVYYTHQPLSGDVIVALAVRPGAYEVTAAGKQQLQLSVEVPKSSEEVQKALSQAATVKLTPNGFDKREIAILPGQGLVIQLETDAAIEIKLVKPYEVSEEKRATGSAFRWTKQPPKDNK